MNDLKFASRQLVKNPGFATVAILTLALGVGVNTSMFSALRTLLARNLPYLEPAALVQVFQVQAGSGWGPHHSAPNVLDYQRSRCFDRVAAWTGKSFNLSLPDEAPERIEGLQVSAEFFPLLGMQPELGRWFAAEEDQPGRNNVVILDHGFWLRRLGGDHEIIGRTLRLDGEAVTVIGVMPERFRDTMLAGPVSLWKPIAFSESQQAERGHQFVKCIARLKSGQSLEEARASAAVLAARQRAAHPDNSPEGLQLVTLAHSRLPPQARTIVWLVMTLAVCVLLIACANLANLQLARTTARGRELAIRGALGAPRGRLLRQLLCESLLLAAIGGICGVILAHWSNALLGRQFLSDGRPILQLGLDSRVLLFAATAALVSGVAFGLVPAWLGSRKDVNEALKQGARGTLSDRAQSGLQQALIAAQVALALMLLAGAGIVVNGLRVFAAAEPGWKVGDVTLGYLTLPSGKYQNDDQLRSFADRLLEKLRSLPGAPDAALCWNLPVRQFNVTSSFGIEGRSEPPKGVNPQCSVNGVTPGYFGVLGMRLLAGRDFTDADQKDLPPVVIINERLARVFWPDGSPIGERLNGAEIVGVVNDVRFPANPAEVRTYFQTYRPLAQEPRPFLNIALRGDVPANLLRQAVAAVDVDQPVGEPGPARADVARSLANWGVGGHVLTLFALLGMVLAGLGIYGVISGFVVRRTGEIGVRMALGAQWSDVFRLVMGRGMRLTAIGAGIGLAGAIGIHRIVAVVLPEMPSGDPRVLPAVVTFLLLVSGLACWLPARRAARVDPMEALRVE